VRLAALSIRAEVESAGSSRRRNADAVTGKSKSERSHCQIATKSFSFSISHSAFVQCSGEISAKCFDFSLEATLILVQAPRLCKTRRLCCEELARSLVLSRSQVYNFPSPRSRAPRSLSSELGAASEKHFVNLSLSLRSGAHITFDSIWLRLRFDG
jgi:hypothetical protein